MVKGIGWGFFFFFIISLMNLVPAQAEVKDVESFILQGGGAFYHPSQRAGFVCTAAFKWPSEGTGCARLLGRGPLVSAPEALGPRGVLQSPASLPQVPSSRFTCSRHSPPSYLWLKSSWYRRRGPGRQAALGRTSAQPGGLRRPGLVAGMEGHTGNFMAAEGSDEKVGATSPFGPS